MQSRVTNVTPVALAALTLCVLAGASVAAGTVDEAAGPESYTWSAELVGIDEAAGTVTVKSYVVGHGQLDIDSLAEGDSAVLTWSGAFTAASGVRSVAPGTMADGRFTMPIEYVGTERDNRYLIFRVQVPKDQMAGIAMLEPGQWVTATSQHAPKGEGMVVSAIRSYTDVG